MALSSTAKPLCESSLWSYKRKSALSSNRAETNKNPVNSIPYNSYGYGTLWTGRHATDARNCLKLPANAK